MNRSARDHRRGSRFALAMPLAVIGALALGGCGASRSPEAFCRVYAQEKQNYLEKYDKQAKALDSTEDPVAGVLGGLGMAFGAIGDVVIIFDKLDKVAPDDIEPDVKAIHDALQKQIDNAGGAASDPLGNLLGGLTSGLTTAGSWQRVGDYVTSHCG